MTKLILRSAASVLLSLVVAVLLLTVVEGVSTVLHPFPPGFGNTPEDMMTHVANYPAWVLALLGGLGWALTIVAATWLATRLGARRHPAHGIGVGLLLIAAALFNMSMLPYPAWFWILDLVLLPGGVYCGVTLGKERAAPLSPA